MLIPALLLGVEQLHTFTCRGINGVSLRTLKTIAHSTGEPQVVLIVRTASRLRADVVDLQWAEDISLGTEAISTPIARPRANALSSRVGYGTHGSRGSRKPR